MVTQIPVSIQILILATAHCLIGVTATAIAYRKGYNFGRWLAIGLIGGTPAFIAATLLKSQKALGNQWMIGS